MPDALKIVQVTDCHVSADPDADYRGLDPRRTLESLLPAIRRWKPDLLLLTGDLAEDGSVASYDYLAETLGGTGIPLLGVPGNHDDPQALRQRFPDTAIEAPLCREMGGWDLVLLNSVVEGEVPGGLSSRMVSGLRDCLARGSRPALVVLHHQPVPTGTPWIDCYPLLAAEEFWSALDRHERVRAVAWGHVHHDYRAQRRGVALLGSPATSANCLAGAGSFTFDPAGPACRWLRLERDGSLETGVLRAGD